MDDVKTTTGMTNDRRKQFEADLSQIKVKTSGVTNEPRLVTVGLVLMGLGPLIALVGFFASGSQSDSRDILSTMILAVFGLSLAVTGAALYLRYSLSRFLRFWMLRMVYEQQNSDES